MQPKKTPGAEPPPSHIYPARYPQELREPPGPDELKKQADPDERLEEEADIPDSTPEEPAPPGEGP